MGGFEPNFYERVWTSPRLTGAANPVTSTKRGSTRRGIYNAPWKDVRMFGARSASKRSLLTGRSIHVMDLRSLLCCSGAGRLTFLGHQ